MKPFSLASLVALSLVSFSAHADPFECQADIRGFNLQPTSSVRDFKFDLNEGESVTFAHCIEDDSYCGKGLLTYGMKLQISLSHEDENVSQVIGVGHSVASDQENVRIEVVDSTDLEQTPEDEAPSHFSVRCVKVEAK